jgi:hypothetical protein
LKRARAKTTQKSEVRNWESKRITDITVIRR